MGWGQATSRLVKNLPSTGRLGRSYTDRISDCPPGNPGGQMYTQEYAGPIGKTGILPDIYLSV